MVNRCLLFVGLVGVVCRFFVVGVILLIARCCLEFVCCLLQLFNVVDGCCWCFDRFVFAAG